MSAFDVEAYVADIPDHRQGYKGRVLAAGCSGVADGHTVVFPAGGFAERDGFPTAVATCTGGGHPLPTPLTALNSPPTHVFFAAAVHAAARRVRSECARCGGTGFVRCPVCEGKRTIPCPCGRCTGQLPCGECPTAVHCRHRRSDDRHGAVASIRIGHVFVDVALLARLLSYATDEVIGLQIGPPECVCVPVSLFGGSWTAAIMPMKEDPLHEPEGGHLEMTAVRL